LDPIDCANGWDQTVDLVLNECLGRAYCEASEDRSDLETTISDLISGQYDNPVRVIAFHAAERWSEDVSENIAREIMRRLGLAGRLCLLPALGAALVLPRPAHLAKRARQ
jgi:hypothetical protein